MIEIKHRYTGKALFRSETAETLGAAAKEGIADGADLGGAYLGGAYLGGAYLGGAYLGGADLGDADLRGAYLGGAYLGGADLGGADLGGADLGDADLRGADLGGADLGGADLGGADLGGADLRGAYLGGAYLAGVRGMTIPADHVEPSTPYVRKVTPQTDRPVLSPEERKARRIAARAESARRYRERHPDVPVVEHLDSKILGAIAAGGILNMNDWHTCETTHCRAGWAVHVAGKAGYELEEKLGSAEQAGRAIYRASTGRAPYFYATNERAMDDIQRCAAEDSESASP
jgi:uncharacterized protein YjbI with pentapeptide repeats